MSPICLLYPAHADIDGGILGHGCGGMEAQIQGIMNEDQRRFGRFKGFLPAVIFMVSRGKVCYHPDIPATLGELNPSQRPPTPPAVLAGPTIRQGRGISPTTSPTAAQQAGPSDEPGKARGGSSQLPQVRCYYCTSLTSLTITCTQDVVQGEQDGDILNFYAASSSP